MKIRKTADIIEPLGEAVSAKRLKILIFSLLIIIISLSAYSFLARHAFKEKIMPQLTKNAETVGKSIASVIKRTYEYDIPLRTIRGYKEFFSSYLSNNNEFEYIAMYDSKGSLIERVTLLKKERESSGNKDYHSTVDILSSGSLVGSLKIGISERYVSRKINAITYDILTVMGITMLVTFELLLFLIAVTVTAPISSIRRVIEDVMAFDFRKVSNVKSKDEIGLFAESVNAVIYRVNRTYVSAKEFVARLPEGTKRLSIKNKLDEVESRGNLIEPSGCIGYFQTLLLYFRPTLFLIVFAEALSISFFPMYVKSLYTPMFGFSRELMTGLPISLFMLFWAFSIPVGGIWSDRKGRKRPMITGSVITALGLFLTSFASNMIMLLIFRAITAVGYGLVYISAQGFIADNTTDKNRTAGMASFVACFYAGSLSGAGIGGILVDRIGYSYTFMSASLLALSGAFIAYKYLTSVKTDRSNAVNKFRLRNFSYLLANRRFITLLVFASIPAKVCLTGYMYYIAPIFLNSFGITNSTIGRFMIGYGLSIVVLSPWSGKMADKTGNRKIYVLSGGLLSAFALTIPLLIPNTAGVFLSILGLGIAHATGLSSQLSIALSLFSEDRDIGKGTVIAIYRLIERIGNISGPLIAGILLSVLPFSKAAGFIGAAVGVSAVIFIIMFWLFDISDRRNNVKTGN